METPITPLASVTSLRAYRDARNAKGSDDGQLAEFPAREPGAIVPIADPEEMERRANACGVSRRARALREWRELREEDARLRAESAQLVAEISQGRGLA